MVKHDANNYPAAKRIAETLVKDGFTNIIIHDYRFPEKQKAKFYVTGKKPRETITWHNYGGHSRAIDAKKEVRWLLKKKFCKKAKVVPKGSEDGTIYWVYTYPKVV